MATTQTERKRPRRTFTMDDEVFRAADAVV